MPDQTENEQHNLVYYEVLTGELETGGQILVQIFRLPNGKISLAQLAVRMNRWETWGKPIRLEHMGTHPTPRNAEPA